MCIMTIQEGARTRKALLDSFTFPATSTVTNGTVFTFGITLCIAYRGSLPVNQFHTRMG